ncbi:MAG: primosomal protein N' [Bacteroidaceae bacterium]|nr:primosomal protein N' [Bacteroidaceae bacterium]
MNLFADVILPVPLQGMFTYSLPPALAPLAQVGQRVSVPFGNKKTQTGIVGRLHDQKPENMEVKEVLELLDERPVVLPRQLSLWQWIADYYLCSIGEVFKAALPGKMKQKTSVCRTRRQKSTPATSAAALAADSLAVPGVDETSLPVLSPAQSEALANIHEQWASHSVCLLHGVTSSGKTEIYIHLIAEAIARGQQVLYLLPEIVLTSQLTERLQAVFGQRLGVYHSKFTDVQRADVWQRQLSPSPFDIIVGVRSSVFLPFSKLGLVIVDEEHEVNFKQQEPAPRYNARNVAILMATRAKAHVLLGTATPSLDSYYNARMGKYGLVRLSERYGKVQLPEIEIVDLKELRRKRLIQGPFSPQLLEKMRQALDAHEQVILFLNRRGYAPHVSCKVCGWVPRCPHCDVSLTLHSRSQDTPTGYRKLMTCHYCGYTTEIPSRCPNCENPELHQHGFGTERIEEDIAAIFPEARVARMDLDTTRTRTAYEQLLHDFAAGQTDILVGTQMVTKGLDFENVSVVGILSADTMLNQPDFRAYERSFQMMSQVSGRAGRRHQRGYVLLQTMEASLPLLQQVVAGDYDAMYQEQMLERRQFAYPPFCRMVFIYMKHRRSREVEGLARELSEQLRAIFGQRVLGPDEPPVARVQSLFIRRIMLKLEPSLPLAKVHGLLQKARTGLLATKTYNSAQIFFDVDPL